MFHSQAHICTSANFLEVACSQGSELKITAMSCFQESVLFYAEVENCLALFINQSNHVVRARK